ncbi:MAG: DUF2163 domain-containing protein [bacterium]|nr:DUF2163 domain-containing protein [bacterium]
MKQLPQGMQAHLDSGATTLCWCWRLTLIDETAYGFTSHDRNLTFDNTQFEAASGFSASELSAGVGLSTDNLEAEGALSSDRLNEDELAQGRFDDAQVEIFRVNWADPAQRVLMSSGSLGEVKRGENSFSAEVRGLSHYLQQPKGRLVQYGCDAALGDTRCTLDVSASSSFRVSGAVTNVQSKHAFTVTGLEGFVSGWFARGNLIWQTGSNAPGRMEIKQHRVLENGDIFIELWQDMAFAITSGETFDAVAGCDKQFSTCRDKFTNHINFRGFPHVPGNDFIISYPGRDDANNDGQSFSQ